MAIARQKPQSLRLGRSEMERLAVALVFSLMLHLVVWGGYEVGKKAEWWKKLRWPALLAVKQPPQQPVEKTNPLIFLDVAEPSIEPPKQAKYYSDKSSQAANAEADQESDQPKLTGKQPEVAKTEDVPKPVKAPPTPPAAAPQKSEASKAAQSNPANTLMPGDLDKASPADSPTPEDNPTKPERPRTLREAMAQKSSQLPGLQMQQSGGVHKRALKSSLDAMATPFGAYDRAIVEAVSQRWYDLLDSQKFASDRTGKVTVKFNLNADGTVTEVKISGNSVGDLLGYVCQAAIEQAAPFGKWPPDMRRMIGANFREITFTFYYY